MISEYITEIQALTTPQWMFIIFCCILVLTSHMALTLVFQWLIRPNKFKVFDPDGIFEPNPNVDVVVEDADQPLGECSLMTITYLLATGHKLSLHGSIIPYKCDTEFTFNGPVNLRLWIITLKSMRCPAGWELLDTLDEMGIDIGNVPDISLRRPPQPVHN